MSGPVCTVADDIIIFCQQKTMAEAKRPRLDMFLTIDVQVKTIIALRGRVSCRQCPLCALIIQIIKYI